ncbi:MAG TPA: PQQ-dependent sugar dehydrogenase [Chthoniobacteraceae bacterium]|nr:PQQ-dependent sugar dehydrogenase [Chthoniobacteraceae bacterium]
MPKLSPLSTLLVLTTVASAQQQILNPIETPIPKGPVQIELETIATGLTSPVQLLAPPDQSGRLLVVDQAGQVRIVQGGKLLPDPFLDVTDRLAKLEKNFDERGLLGLAFDPAFNDANSPGYRRVFAYVSEKLDPSVKSDFPDPHLKENEKPNHQTVIASWKVSDSDPNRVDPASRKEILRLDQPQFNHDGGMIAFGPDKFLYIALGDGGGANDLGPGHNPEIGNAQDTNVLLGKMLRIDVNGKDSANGKYGIPKDNPYVAGGGLKEIYAIGLRNPYRFSFDGDTLWVGDVGQNRLEWVHRVERGKNYGWRLKEGTFKFNKTGIIEKDTTGLPAGLVDPVLQYDHDEGTSVIGGFVYRGKARADLTGKYVFGDYDSPKQSQGRLFYADLNTKEIREFKIGNDGRELGFLLKGIGCDNDGEIYATGSTSIGPAGNTGVVMKIK